MSGLLVASEKMQEHFFLAYLLIMTTYYNLCALYNPSPLFDIFEASKWQGIRQNKTK